MTWTGCRTWISVLVLLTWGCAGSHPREIVGELAVVVESAGVPEVLRNARPYMLARASQLYPGDVVKTDAASRVTLQFATGSALTLGPRSQLRLIRLLLDEEITVAELHLAAGNLEVRPASEGRHHWNITTSIASVTSESGGIWLSYTNNGGRLDVVALSSNPVKVSNRDGEVLLSGELQGTGAASGIAPVGITTWSEQRFRAVRQRRLLLREN